MLKKNDIKIVEAIFLKNHPKKELASKKTKFECKISSVKIAVESKLDDDFAKKYGGKKHF